MALFLGFKGKLQQNGKNIYFTKKLSSFQQILHDTPLTAIIESNTYIYFKLITSRIQQSKRQAMYLARATVPREVKEAKAVRYLKAALSSGVEK